MVHATQWNAVTGGGCNDDRFVIIDRNISLYCYTDLSKLLHGFVKVKEMLHATQRNVVTGGGCDCDKAIYGKIMFDHIAIINIAVVLILIFRIIIINIITLKIMTKLTLTMKIIIIIVGII